MSHVRAVAFDCFGTLLHIRAPLNPWKAIFGAPRQDPCAPKLDPRREPIPTIEEFAAAYGVEFRLEWRCDLDAEGCWEMPGLIMPLSPKTKHSTLQNPSRRPRGRASDLGEALDL